MDDASKHMSGGLDELTVELDQNGVAVRGARWGDRHVEHCILPPNTDLTPFFAGLPDGLCTIDHFGIVLDGSITLRYKDGSEERTSAGDLYYWPAGHTAWTEEGVVFVAVSPLAQTQRMEEQMAAAADPAS